MNQHPTQPGSSTHEPATGQSEQRIGRHERISFRRLAVVGPLTVIAASVGAALAALLELALGVLPADQPLFQPFSVAIGTALQVALGVMVFALIGYFARRPIRTFRIVALVVLVLSLLNPLSAGLGMMPGFEIEGVAVVGLMVLHLVAGAITIWMLTTQARA